MSSQRIWICPSRNGGEEDLFISPKNFKDAMHGDRVVARVETVRKQGKEGKIIRILERGLRRVVGRFMKAKHYAYVVAEDERILQEIFIPRGRRRGRGRIRSLSPRLPATRPRGRAPRAG